MWKLLLSKIFVRYSFHLSHSYRLLDAFKLLVIQNIGRTSIFTILFEKVSLRNGGLGSFSTIMMSFSPLFIIILFLSFVEKREIVF